MNEKFNKNAKVEKFTKKLGRGVRLIVIGPFLPQIDKKVHQKVPQNLPQAFCFGDVRRHDIIKREKNYKI